MLGLLHDGFLTIPPRSYSHYLSYLDELLSLHRGQGLELLWRDSLQCPTEEEYVAMVNNSSVMAYPDRFLRPWKLDWTLRLPAETGGLLRIGIKLMMACSTTNSDVYVSISYLFIIAWHHINHSQKGLCSTRESHWNIFSNTRRLYEPTEHRGEPRHHTTSSLSTNLKSISMQPTKALPRISARENSHSLLCIAFTLIHLTDKSLVCSIFTFQNPTYWFINRCPTETTNNAHSQNTHHIIPQESH